jgi:superfamily I DNA/RNA helicase
VTTDTIRKIYGPPGTGKTRKLTEIAIKAAGAFGPDRICALTYTRTGAEELRLRIAAALNMHPPMDTWQQRRFFAQRLPWVGTIHSLAYRLLGHQRKVLQAKEITEFVHSQGGHGAVAYPDRVEDAEGYQWAEPGRDEVEAALAVYAGARHRLMEVRQAYDVVPWGMDGPTVSVERCEYIARQYEEFKHYENRIDFEDMLEQGRDMLLPVDVVLADEVQDNSPLLWSVLDSWAAGKHTFLAGDPYQAIYLFSGAEPRLFIDHPGTLQHLGDSHRLDAPSAEYAQSVLRAAGFADAEWLGTWTGLAQPVMPERPSEFWLARTGRLVQGVRSELEAAGTPFGYLNGGGPLQTKAADAYRTLLRLQQRGGAPAGAVALLAGQMEKGWVPHTSKAYFDALARDDPDQIVSAEDLAARLGRVETLPSGLKHGLYFERVKARHGMQPFFEPPTTLIGTIHAAKGREADRVHLVDSWGTLPYKALMNGQHEAEACVAYVALTRHKVARSFEPADEGYPYPW